MSDPVAERNAVAKSAGTVIVSLGGWAGKAFEPSEWETRVARARRMIARVWRGATRAEDADEYAAYIEETGMKARGRCPGNRGTLVLRRVHDGRAEFETILLFDSLDDIRAFAGDDIEVAVFFPEDDRYLVEREPTVRHFEVDVNLP